MASIIMCIFYNVYVIVSIVELVIDVYSVSMVCINLCLRASCVRVVLLVFEIVVSLFKRLWLLMLCCVCVSSCVCVFHCSQMFGHLNVVLFYIVCLYCWFAHVSDCVLHRGYRFTRGLLTILR